MSFPSDACLPFLHGTHTHQFKGDSARVINIASVAALSPASTDGPTAAWAYAASKAAVTHMSRGLGKALGKRDISTNGVP
eukprot:SAG11_NODE_8429_length_1016_cov_1.376227_1_plen_79_part_10